MRNKPLFLAAGLLIATTGHAMAFATNSCSGQKIKWNTNGPTLNVSDVSFPAGYWRNGIQRSASLTNANPSPFFFPIATDTGGLGLSNNQNEVWGTTDNSLLADAPARAFLRWNCFIVGSTITSNIIEADVIFDYRAPFQWTADELKASIIRYGGTLRQLQGTAVHEFGHALGLNHVNTEYNIMGADFEHIWANGVQARGYLGEDASDGTVFLYGLWSANYEDLGVSHWKYSFASGEYSRHVKTGITKTNGAALPTSIVAGETVYSVKRGQSVIVEFTYENNGKTTKVVNTGWYISANNVISRTDRLLATNTGMSLGRGDVLTYKRTVQIPNNMTVNTNYWLGTIVDKNSVVSDNVPSNNATYIPIRVVP
jgi:hypothetical protein